MKNSVERKRAVAFLCIFCALVFALLHIYTYAEKIFVDIMEICSLVFLISIASYKLCHWMFPRKKWIKENDD